MKPVCTVGLAVLLVASLCATVLGHDTPSSQLHDTHQPLLQEQQHPSQSVHFQKKRSVRTIESLENAILFGLGPNTDIGSKPGDSSFQVQQSHSGSPSKKDAGLEERQYFKVTSADDTEGSTNPTSDIGNSLILDPMSSDNLRIVDLALARLRKSLSKKRGSATGLKNPDVNSFRAKRPSFSPWAGRKRSAKALGPWSDVDTKRTSRDCDTQGDGDQTTGDSRSEESSKTRSRSRFRAWRQVAGGHSGLAKRQSFSPWNGKRAAFNPWNGKRSTPQLHQASLSDGTAESLLATNNEVSDSKTSVSYNSLPYSTSDSLSHWLEKLNNEFSTDEEPQDGMNSIDKTLAPLGKLNSLRSEKLADIILKYHRMDDGDESESEDKKMDKRTPFPPWDDKRSYKDNSFRPWNGKRSTDDGGSWSPQGKRSRLDDIKFGSRSLRAALKSQARQEILMALQNLYRRLEDRQLSEDGIMDSSPEIDNKDEDYNDQDEIENSSELQEDKEEEEAPPKTNMFITIAQPNRKRPAFHSWLGKRDALFHSNRHKRSSNPSEATRVKTQVDKTVDTGTLLPTPAQDKMTQPSSSNISADIASEDILSTLSTAGAQSAEFQSDTQSELNKQKRPSFSAWHGKRNIEQTHTNNKDGTTKEQIVLDSKNGKEESIQENTLVSSEEKANLREDESTEKRSRGFSAWHGKRNSLGEEDKNLGGGEIMEKRARGFSAWHGKRSYISDRGEQLRDSDIVQEKRTRGFSAWHGKRNVGEGDENSRDGEHVDEKRSRSFSAWYGKRNVGEGDENSRDGEHVDEKRSRSFSAWHGKRNALETEENSYDGDLMGEKRSRQFSAWHGKRSSVADSEERLRDGNTMEDKRSRSFSAWHGKRNSEEQLEENLRDLANTEKRTRGFSAWHGKRNSPSSGGIMVDKRSREFSAWHGKRDVDGEGEENSRISESFDDKRSRGFSAWHGKRDSLIDGEIMGDKRSRSFSAWYGKRNVGEEIQGEITNSEDTEKRPRALSAWNGNMKSLVQLEDGELPEDKRSRSFSAWHGKRSVGGEGGENSEDGDTEKRSRSFSAWHGKRSPFGEEISQGGDIGENKRSRSFSAWHGKRSHVTDGEVAGEKRSRGFSAWHGKRSPKIDGEVAAEKRSRGFSAWHGKRSSMTDGEVAVEKRSRGFSAWHGKRSSVTGGEVSGEKRSRGFSAWHGKRSSVTDGEVSGEKRSRGFSAWHGKRSSVTGGEVSGEKRSRGFSAWHGKRSSVTDGEVSGEKRSRGFMAWHGKRHSIANGGPYYTMPGDNDENRPRPNFDVAYIDGFTQHKPQYIQGQEQTYLPLTQVRSEPYGGGSEETEFRYIATEVGDPTETSMAANSALTENEDQASSPVLVLAKRPGFSAWHGKRKREANWSSIGQHQDRPQLHAWSRKSKRHGNYFGDQIIKRSAFHAWSGKKRGSVGVVDAHFFTPYIRRPYFPASSDKTFPRETFPEPPLLRRLPHLSYSQPFPHTPMSSYARIFLPQVSLPGNLFGAFSKRPQFQAWSGKRRVTNGSPFQRQLETAGQSDGLTHLMKRPAFSAWSGKRGVDQGLSRKSDSSP